MRSVLLQEMLRHNAGRLNDAFFLGAYHQPYELRHAPRQRRRASRTAAKHKSRAARVRLIPNLLGNHAARIRELQHRVQIQTRIAPRRNLILAALTREDRPDAPDAFALPGAPEISFAVAVVAVAVKAGTIWGFDANRGIHNLNGVLNDGIVRWTDAQAHKFQEARVHHVAFVPHPAAVAR